MLQSVQMEAEAAETPGSGIELQSSVAGPQRREYIQQCFVGGMAEYDGGRR